MPESPLGTDRMIRGSREPSWLPNLREEEKVERYLNDQLDLRHLYAHDESRWTERYYQHRGGK